MATKEIAQRRTRTVSSKEYVCGFFKGFGAWKIIRNDVLSPCQSGSLSCKVQSINADDHFRDLTKMIGRHKTESFMVAIQRVVYFCKVQSINADDHFREVTKMIGLGSGAKRKVND
jgi:hypothetical protein